MKKYDFPMLVFLGGFMISYIAFLVQGTSFFALHSIIMLLMVLMYGQYQINDNILGEKK